MTTRNHSSEGSPSRHVLYGSRALCPRHIRRVHTQGRRGRDHPKMSVTVAPLKPKLKPLSSVGAHFAPASSSISTAITCGMHARRLSSYKISCDCTLDYDRTVRLRDTVGPPRETQRGGARSQCFDRTCHEVQVSARTHHTSTYIIHSEIHRHRYRTQHTTVTTPCEVCDLRTSGLHVRMVKKIQWWPPSTGKGQTLPRRRRSPSRTRTWTAGCSWLLRVQRSGASATARQRFAPTTARPLPARPRRISPRQCSSADP